jgi:isopentenyl-diphosphate delta-isomerase
VLFDVDKNKYVMQIDSTDRLINEIPKIEAHLKGIRHKAFSVLIFNNDDKMLIQKKS